LNPQRIQWQNYSIPGKTNGTAGQKTDDLESFIQDNKASFA
jgi:hypothetical protein